MEALLGDTKKILKECSRLIKQVASDPTSHTSDLLNSEILKGELLEHQLFQLCAKEGVSLNQLQLLGHKITFSQWRRNNYLHHHDPITPNLGTSRESSTLPVIPNESLTNSSMGTSEESSTLPVSPKEFPAPTMVLESPTLPVIPRESLTLPVIPPPVILEEPLDMSDPLPWLVPRHLRRLFRTSSPSPPSLPTHSEDNVTTPQ